MHTAVSMLVFESMIATTSLFSKTSFMARKADCLLSDNLVKRVACLMRGWRIELLFAPVFASMMLAIWGSGSRISLPALRATVVKLVGVDERVG